MKTSAKIIQYIKVKGQITGSELVEYLDITDRAVRKQLKALIDSGQLTKAGKPPKVYYSIAPKADTTNDSESNSTLIDKISKKAINENFLYITPVGTEQKGWEGFIYWCRERKLELIPTAVQYIQTISRYSLYKKNGLIDGMHKMKTTFDEVALDKLFYIDFYSIEIFGKTKLGQLLLFAKQSQDRMLINEIAVLIKPTVLGVIQDYQIDGVGFIPPTIKREIQLMGQVEKMLNLDVKKISITKIKTPVVVPQKTLTKLEDRIINAKETISIDGTKIYNNILLIDDAVVSGATLNETAKKIRQKGLCKGQIIGLAITGSFSGSEVISEI